MALAGGNGASGNRNSRISGDLGTSGNLALAWGTGAKFKEFNGFREFRKYGPGGGERGNVARNSYAESPRTPVKF